MRTVALVLLLLLAACGEEEKASHPRVRLGTFDIDGAPPAGLVLLSKAEDETTPHPMLAVAGEPGIYEVPGAPWGAFRVLGPKGWASLKLDVMLPELREGEAPPYVHLGAPHTLYVGSAFPDYRPSLLWAAERTDGGRSTPIVPKAQVVPGGRFVALRFPPEAWQGEFALTGFLTRGSAERMSAKEAAQGRLSDPLGIAIRAKDQPALVRAGPVPTAPLQVRLVPAADGASLAVTFVGLALPFRAEAESAEGVIRFPHLPALDRSLSLLLAAGPLPHVVTADHWRDLETLYLLSFDQARGRQVRLEADGEAPPARVIARPAGASAYGLAPRGEGDAFLLPRTEMHVLVEAGGRWGVATLDAGATVLAEIAFVDAVRVEGRVDGWTTGTIGGLRLYRHEGEDRVTGHALACRVPSQGTFSLRIPPGTYDVEVSSPAGTWRRPTPLHAEQGGAHLHATLRAP